MLLNSVIIILREVLEAALLMSVCLASNRFLRSGHRWAIAALLAGAAGAILYGYFLEPISELFDGVGQEVCNALLQYTACMLLVIVVFLIPQRLRDSRSAASNIALFMALATAIAITREGAEILVYVSGLWQVSEFFSAVAIGSVLGAGIGCSVGVLLYYLLVAQPVRWALPTTLVLLHLIAAGMASQATRLLVQADWITTGGAVWDSSGILSEQSLAGQLLYAFVGYEASPSAIEALTYAGSLVLVATAWLLGTCKARSARQGSP